MSRKCMKKYENFWVKMGDEKMWNENGSIE